MDARIAALAERARRDGHVGTVTTRRVEPGTIDRKYRPGL
jgi:hypothetical protein